MKIYTVGGAIRDELLGLPVQDRDYVVVGATPQQMLKAGFKPVGKDFPVFLHPQTHEEYALARTERKTAPGYAGFSFHASPEVTLEDDLRRRDLTINAMARGDDDVLVDPYGGQRDLELKLLRHVSDAFTEDPVRILRVARFAARFTDFNVAPATMSLMKVMVADGEVDALVSERVWQELSRGLMEPSPSRMIRLLRECDALARLVPELEALLAAHGQTPPPTAGDRLLDAVDRSARLGHPLSVRFAVLTHQLAADLDTMCARMRVPTALRELAKLTSAEYAGVEAIAQGTAAGMVALFERCDAFRKPARFDEFMMACSAIAADDRWPAARRLSVARTAASRIDAGLLARSGPPESIRERIHAARVRAVDAVSNAGPGVMAPDAWPGVAKQDPWQ